ncbi:MAG: hypothetical protein ACPGVN_04885, partial [Alphaproteobacteria bacterium]
NELMFAKKQIYITGLITGGLLASLSAPLMAQSQFFPAPAIGNGQAAISAQAQPLFTAPQQQFAAPQQQLSVQQQPFQSAQWGSNTSYNSGQMIGYGAGNQIIGYGANVTAAPVYTSSYTQPVVQYQQAPQYAQYVQSAPTYAYVQAQPRPTTTYAYVQAQPKPSVAQYQYYATSYQPILPKPQVYTATYNSGYAHTGATSSYSHGPKNLVPYKRCVAGCQEACSQNLSFLSHCVKACAYLVKASKPQQSTPVDWKRVGATTGHAVINGKRW